jgi:hypothetical protein
VTDLVLTEQRGWHELDGDEVDEAIESGDLDINALWLALAADDVKAAKKIIAVAFVLKRGEPVDEIFAMKEPGDEGEDRVRIWLK